MDCEMQRGVNARNLGRGSRFECLPPIQTRSPPPSPRRLVGPEHLQHHHRVAVRARDTRHASEKPGVLLGTAKTPRHWEPAGATLQNNLLTLAS